MAGMNVQIHFRAAGDDRAETAGRNIRLSLQIKCAKMFRRIGALYTEGRTQKGTKWESLRRLVWCTNISGGMRMIKSKK